MASPRFESRGVGYDSLVPTVSRDPKHKAQRGVFAYRALGRLWWGVEYRHPLTGKRTRKMRFTRQLDAIDYRERMEAQRLGVEEPDPTRRTLARAIEAYLEHRKTQGRNRRSYDKLGLWVERFGSEHVAEISSQRIRTAIDEMSQERKWSSQTRNNALAQLGGFYSWAMIQVPPLAVRHPIADGRVPLAKVDNERDRWLTAEELGKLVDACPPWLRDLVRFSAATGMRLGEATALRASSYREDAKGGTWLELRKTKSGAPLRYPLSGWIARLVAGRVRGRKADARIFPGPGGGGASMAIKREFPAAVKAAGLVYGRKDATGVTWHTLRHTFASQALQAGLREIEVMSLGNWKDPRMLRRYAHLSDDSRRDAAAVVAGVLSPRKLSAKLSAAASPRKSRRSRRA